MVMTFNVALEAYNRGLKVQSIASKKIYALNLKDINAATKEEKMCFWFDHVSIVNKAL